MKHKSSFFKSSGMLVVGLVILNLAIAIGSARYFLSEKEVFLHEKTSQLKSIANIRKSQIDDWFNERLSDARYLSTSRQIVESFQAVARDPENSSSRLLLFNSLNAMFLNGKYESMLAIDRLGKCFYSIPEKGSSVSSGFYEKYNLDARPKKIKISDLYVSEDSAVKVHITAPIFQLSEADTVVLGWLILNINLKSHLFALLESFPGTYKTLKESLITKDEGNIVFLNSPRILKLSTSSLKDSTGKNALSALKAVNGFVGTEESIDYNGIPVLASMLNIPGRNAFLIVEIDRTEAYSEIRRMKIIALMFATILIIALTSLVSFFWLRQSDELKGLAIERKLISDRYDMLSKYANDAILLYTDDLIILQANDKALEKYGYPKDEILGMSVELLRNSQVRDGLDLMLSKIVKEGGHQYETIHRRKDGTEFPVEISTRYIEILGNNCFLSIIRDITLRKQIEKALIESEERLRLITNTMPEIVWTAKQDGNFDFVNSRFEALTGLYPLKENALKQVIHPSDYDGVADYWKHAVTDIREHQFQFRLHMKDGSYRWFLCRAIPLRGDNGHIIRWFGSATDIDELENLVAQRTAELSDLYNNAPCGYHSLDAKGTYVLVNDTELSWLGYTREEIIGKRTFSDMLTPESREKLRSNFAMLKHQGTLNNLQFEMIRKDGTILPVLLSATAILDNSGNISNIRTTIIDHTERKGYENEILKLNNVLQQHAINLEYANQELEAFSFSVSHDLRAPLRAIKGFSRIMLEDYRDKIDQEGQKLLNTVCDNAQQMNTLIDDLLRLSRTGRQELMYSKINMEALFKSLIEEVKQLFPDRPIKVNFNPLPEAYGDLALLKQLIGNLLSNAIKFSGKQSVSEIEIGSVLSDTELIYFVRDNGTGFNMKYAPDLFGVFKRFHNSEDYEGTGVGLAIVKRIVDKHGGRVWAESQPNKSSTFYFALPVSKTN